MNKYFCKTVNKIWWFCFYLKYVGFKIIRWTGEMWQLKINLFNLCLAICVLANYYYSFTFKIVTCFNRNDIFSGKRQNIFTFSLLFYGKYFRFKGAKDVQRKPLNEEEFRFSWLILQVLVVSYNKERKMKSSLLPLVRLNTTYISYYAKANSIWKPCKFHEGVTIK